MGVTDYHSTHKGKLATIPYVAHEIEIAKHKRREKWLSIALAVSVVIGIINLVIH
jgi:hypothetical protein